MANTKESTEYTSTIRLDEDFYEFVISGVAKEKEDIVMCSCQLLFKSYRIPFDCKVYLGDPTTVTFAKESDVLYINQITRELAKSVFTKIKAEIDPDLINKIILSTFEKMKLGLKKENKV